MATIARIALTSDTGTPQTIAATELTGTDDFTGNTGTLWMVNSSGSSVTVTIDGSTAATDHYCNGAGTKDLSPGYSITVPANGIIRQPLSEIAAYLSGTIAVTGGSSVIDAFIIT